MKPLQPSRETIEKVKNLEGAIAPLTAHIASASSIPPALDDKLTCIKETMGNPADLHQHDLRLGAQRVGVVLFLDGMVDSSRLHSFILNPIFELTDELQSVDDVVRLVESGNLPAPNLEKVTTVEDLVQRIILGHAVLSLDSLNYCWAIDIRMFEHRMPSEPMSEPTISGAQEGFIEVLQVNVTTIRRLFRTYLLRVEHIELGRLSKRQAAMLYVLGRSDPASVDHVRRRLQSADWDHVFSTQQVISVLEEHRWSFFSQFRQTERPDVAIAGLNEGRIVIILDGTPFVIIAPSTFNDFLQSPDDYYLRYPFAVFIRMLRYLATFLTLSLLPLYVAVLNYHQELLPTYFLLTLIAAREGVPFPTVAEAVGLNLGFDFIREASTRMPKTVGGAITIVGALIIGQSAVQGGLISAPMVILIGLAAVSAFVVPSFNITIPFRVLNYMLLGLAGMMGLFGLSVGLMIILAHMASMRSLGVPYLIPIGPFTAQGWQDLIIRLPWHKQPNKPPLDGSPILDGDDQRADKRSH